MVLLPSSGTRRWISVQNDSLAGWAAERGFSVLQESLSGRIFVPSGNGLPLLAATLY